MALTAEERCVSIVREMLDLAEERAEACDDEAAALLSEGAALIEQLAAPSTRCTCYDVSNEYSEGAYAAASRCPVHRRSPVSGVSAERQSGESPVTDRRVEAANSAEGVPPRDSLASNERLREAIERWDGLRNAAASGIQFDVLLTKRALAMEAVIDAARSVIASPETDDIDARVRKAYPREYEDLVRITLSQERLRTPLKASVRHAVTCKKFPDPYDEREPTGPCTCGAEKTKARQFRPLGGTDWNLCGNCQQPATHHLQTADGTLWCVPSPRTAEPKSMHDSNVKRFCDPESEPDGR